MVLDGLSGYAAFLSAALRTFGHSSCHGAGGLGVGAYGSLTWTACCCNKAVLLFTSAGVMVKSSVLSAPQIACSSLSSFARPLCLQLWHSDVFAFVRMNSCVFAIAACLADGLSGCALNIQAPCCCFFVFIQRVRRGSCCRQPQLVCVLCILRGLLQDEVCMCASECELHPIGLIQAGNTDVKSFSLSLSSKPCQSLVQQTLYRQPIR